MKVDRNKIHQKFGGRCAYCGYILPDSSGKHMQIDHIIPKRNFYVHVMNKTKVPQFLRHLNNTDVNHIDNLVPTCIKCNKYKDTMHLQEFRDQIKLSEQRLKAHACYNNAVRFGMIEFKEWDGLFYFERL